MQTGTAGKQQYWSQQAVGVQQAGGLAGPDVAHQMLTSMDIAFGAQGGIKAPQILALGRQLAPFIGANQMGGEQVTKLFEFAGTAGISPNAKAYKSYFAKLQAGYTASKATDFGQFMLGLQKGGTSYMAQGGSFEQAISQFSAARSVTANESLAATMLEQMSRLASGAYERPRQAIERAMGVNWADMSMDERTAVTLQYVSGLPESERTQRMVSAGIPTELTTSLGKMVSPEAMSTAVATSQKLTGASSTATDELTQTYLKSMLGASRRAEAQKSEIQLNTGPRFAAWQNRLGVNITKHEALVSAGEDNKTLLDKIEPHHMALREIEEELASLMESLPQNQQTGARSLLSRIQRITRGESEPIYLPGYGSTGGIDTRLLHKPARLSIKGQEFEAGLSSLKQSQVTHIHHHNDIIYNPVVGSDDRGPRLTQD